MSATLWTKPYENRRSFIGGSDARVIMGSDEAALVRLWREKRGEVEPEDLSSNLVVQLGRATEDLNRSWYERNTGRQVRDVQRRVRHSGIPWMAATAALFRHTRDACLDDERARSELKALMPEDAKEAIGHGVRGKRSKAGAVSFDVLTMEAVHAPVQ